MKALITPSHLSGNIKIISSKSVVQRALLTAAFCDTNTTIFSNNECDDIKTFTECLINLGVSIDYFDGGLVVNPILKKSDECEINCGEDATALRFLLPTVLALGINCRIKRSDVLAHRPINELCDCLSKNGARITMQGSYIVTDGYILPGDYRITGEVSSQYISGLMIALPLLNGDSRIIIDGKMCSSYYIALTIKILKDFGIEINVISSNEFLIRGNQKFKSPKKYEAEGDWSAASYWLVADMLGCNICVKGLDIDSLQADRAICDIVNVLNGKIVSNNGSIIPKNTNLKQINFDAENCPDLIPALAALSVGVNEPSFFTGVERLKLKESNRLESIIKTVSSLGGNAYYSDGVLHINGGITGGIVYPNHDHRIVMSAAIMAIICKEKVLINDFECVSKSYPKFFDDYISLGGMIEFF